MILEPETDDHIIEAIEEIVQTYEKKLSLYDLLAHFPIDHIIRFIGCTLTTNSSNEEPILVVHLSVTNEDYI
ncbi:hypothetical protein TNCV_3764522 [Trichonephila clavipes]|uniref:Uncharacterized protein n=1 Tax=Trichonephila clavipes TaxID=2585209 RepID=A0A8X6VVC4_TRICX|nr:hypothetical protein TNCV_3764522 [Trichonephila clavipes]